MSASRIWISAIRCGSVAVSASASRLARSMSAASTTSIRLSGPLGASCARRPTRQRGGSSMSALLGRDVAGDDVEQRGLAAAVAAHQPDAGAGRDPRRRLVDQKPAGNADGKVVDVEHGRALWRTAARRRNRFAQQVCAAPSVVSEQLRPARAAGHAGRRPRKRMETVMCVPGCQEAVRAALSRRGFFKGAAAAGFAATAVAPRRHPSPPRRPGASRRWSISPTPCRRIFRPSSACRGSSCRSSSTSRRTASISTGGASSSMPARTSTRRSIFRNPATPSKRSPADTLVAPLAVVDVRSRAAQNPDYLVSRQDLADWEKKNRRLPDRCCVAMLSGWGDYAGDGAKYTGASGGTFHFPGFSAEAAEWLLKERSVVGLAVDTLSLDHGPSKDFRVHRLWLPTGRWGLENVANLDKVPRGGRHAGGGRGQGEKRNRRPGPADRADLIDDPCDHFPLSAWLCRRLPADQHISVTALAVARHDAGSLFKD